MGCEMPGEMKKHLKDALNWKCDCGAVCEPMSAEWRWNGAIKKAGGL